MLSVQATHPEEVEVRGLFEVARNLPSSSPVCVAVPPLCVTLNGYIVREGRSIGHGRAHPVLEPVGLAWVKTDLWCAWGGMQLVLFLASSFSLLWIVRGGSCAGGYQPHPAFLRRIEVDMKPYKANGGIQWEDISILSYVGDTLLLRHHHQSIINPLSTHACVATHHGSVLPPPPP